MNHSHIVVFDGTCVFCTGFARFIVRYDRQRRFRFATAQSATGRMLYERHRLDPDLMATNIVIVDGVAHVRLAGFAAVMRAIGGPWRVLAVLDWIPQPFSDRLYDWIARNRYRFGRRQSCPIPSEELRGRLVD